MQICADGSHAKARTRSGSWRPCGRSEGAVGRPCDNLRLNEPLVFVVRADPKPDEHIVLKDGQRMVSCSNSGRPDFAYFLESE